MRYEVAKEAFKDLNGGTFAGIDTVTTVTLPGGKKNPFQGRVTKVMLDAGIMVFSDTKSNAYENMVNRRLKAEAAEAGREYVPFEVGERKWGTKIENTPFVEHKGAYYLQALFTQSPSSVFYFLDDKPLDLGNAPKLSLIDINEHRDEKTALAFLNDWWDKLLTAMVKEAPAGTGQGGLINKVIIRTFKLENILELRANGKIYKK